MNSGKKVLWLVPPKLLELSLHCKVLREWKLNLTMMVRSVISGWGLDFDKIFRVEPPMIESW